MVIIYRFSCVNSFSLTSFPKWKRCSLINRVAEPPPAAPPHRLCRVSLKQIPPLNGIVSQMLSRFGPPAST
jgi:hypothetical protein